MCYYQYVHKCVCYWFLLYKLCPISAPDYRFIICVEKIGWHQDFGASILHQDLSSLPFCTQIQSQHVSTSKKKLQMDSATRIVVLNTWLANWSASNCLRIFVAREGAVAPPVHTKNWLQDYLMQVATTQPSWVWLHIILYQTSLRIPTVKFQVMNRSFKLINHLSNLAYGSHFTSCCLNHDTLFPLNTCRLLIVSKECHRKLPFWLNDVFQWKHAYSFEKATIRYLSMISVLVIKVSNIFH